MDNNKSKLAKQSNQSLQERLTSLTKQINTLQPFLAQWVHDHWQTPTEDTWQINDAIVGDNDLKNFTKSTEGLARKDEHSKKQGHPARGIKQWPRTIAHAHNLTSKPLIDTGATILATAGDSVIFAYPNNPPGAYAAIMGTTQAQRNLEHLPAIETLDEQLRDEPVTLLSRMGMATGQLVTGIIECDGFRLPVYGGPAVKAGETMEERAEPGKRALFTQTITDLLAQHAELDLDHHNVDLNGTIIDGYTLTEAIHDTLPFTKTTQNYAFTPSPVTTIKELTQQVTDAQHRLDYLTSFFPPEHLDDILNHNEPSFKFITPVFINILPQKKIIDYALQTNDEQLAAQTNLAYGRKLIRAIRKTGGTPLKMWADGKLIAYWTQRTAPQLIADTARYLYNHSTDDAIANVHNTLPTSLQEQVKQLPIVAGVEDGFNVFKGILSQPHEPEDLGTYDLIGSGMNLAARHMGELTANLPTILENERTENPNLPQDVLFFSTTEQTRAHRGTMVFTSKGHRYTPKGAGTKIIRRIDKYKIIQDDTLIGRDEELQHIDALVHQLYHDNNSISLNLSALPGRGKTVLARALENNFTKKGGQVYVGHATEHAQTPWALIKSLMTNYLSLKPSDDAQTIQTKIETRIQEPDDKNILNHLLALGLDYDAPNATTPEEYAELVQTTLQHALTNGPTLITLEDIHWADEQSLRTINALEQTIPHNILWTKTYRKGDLPKNYHHYVAGEHISLDDLDEQGTTALLHYYLNKNTKGMTIQPGSHLQQFVWNRTNGSPLHIEELYNYLSDNNHIKNGELTTETINVETLNSIGKIVQQRFDALPADQQELLTIIASTYGEQASKEILETLLDTPWESPTGKGLKNIIDELVNKDFLLRTNGTARFKHKTTQETIYGRRDNAQVHERIGEAIEQTYAERLSSHFDELAWTYDRTDNDTKAVFYAFHAGVQYINPLTLNHKQAKSITSRVRTKPFNPGWTDDEKQWYLRSELITAISDVALANIDDAIRTYTDLAERSQQITDDTIREQLQWKIAYNHADVLSEYGRHEEARPLWEQAERIGSKYMDNNWKGALLVRKSLSFPEQRIDILNEALGLVRPEPGVQPTPFYTLAASSLLMACAEQHNQQEFNKQFPDALAAAEQLDDKMGLGTIYLAKAMISNDNTDKLHAFTKAEEYMNQTNIAGQQSKLYEQRVLYHCTKNEKDHAQHYYTKLTSLFSATPDAETDTLTVLEQKINKLN